MNTQEICERLLAVIQEKRPDELHYLGKGLSREEIESKIKTRPIPETLIDLYSCMSGTPDIDLHYCIISSGWNLLYINDVNEVIDRIAESNKLFFDLFPDYKFGMYSKTMIPFLYDGHGNFICVKNLPNDDSLWFIPKAGDHCVAFNNINHFLLTGILCYEREAYYWDEEEGYWDNDPDFEEEIMEEIRLSLEALETKSGD